MLALASIGEKISEASNAVLGFDEVKSLEEQIADLFLAMSGPKQNVNPSLGFSATDAARIKLADLQRSEEQLEEARKRLSRLHDAIELGTMSARDADVRERLKSRRAEIDGLNATVATLRQQLERGPTSITPSAVTRFGEVVRQRLIEGDSKARQKIVHAFVKTVRVGERIKIEGETDALAQGVAALARSRGSVPSFDRRWCPEEDSNLHALASAAT